MFLFVYLFLSLSFIEGAPGIDYWYSVDSICDLYGLESISDDVNLIAQSAFQFALTDRMELMDRDSVQIITSTDNANTVRSLRTVFSHEMRYPFNETFLIGLFPTPTDSSEDVYSTIQVRTWSPSLSIAQDVRVESSYFKFKWHADYFNYDPMTETFPQHFKFFYFFISSA